MDLFPVWAPGIWSEAAGEVVSDSFGHTIGHQLRVLLPWQGGLNPAAVRWPPRASEAMQRHDAPASLQIPKLQPPSVRAGAPKMP